MVSAITVTETDNGIDLIEVAIQGPEGPPGPTAPVLMGSAYILALSATNLTVPIIPSARYPFTMTSLHNLVCSSGTITLTITINGVPVTGLSGIVVTNTRQDPVATALNEVSVNDEVAFILSGATAVTDFKFTMQGTPQPT